jgi:hypothetical protein
VYCRHHERRRLATRQHLSGGARRRVTEEAERGVATNALDLDGGTVARELGHHAGDERSGLVLSDELDERQRRVEGFDRHRTSPPSPALIGVDRCVVTRVGRFATATGRTTAVAGQHGTRLLGAASRRRGRRDGHRAELDPAAHGDLERSGPALLLGSGPGGHAALRTPDGVALEPHPSDAGNRLAPDQSTGFEEPLVLPVELLEGVVGEHRGPGLLGDLEDELVPAADAARGRGEQLVRGQSLVVELLLGFVDAMFEGCVDDDRAQLVRSLTEECPYRLVQLTQARQRPSLGSDVRSIDDDVVSRHVGTRVKHLPAQTHVTLPYPCETRCLPASRR